jgi:hypothetical protein
LEAQARLALLPRQGREGTCINEAALVASGFEYKKINSVHHMPECFSRPICALAMSLNDCCTDEERQRLLPYVTRLACADTPEIEHKRALYIARHTIGLVFGIPFEKGLSILDGALAIGKQADPLGPEEVQTRMEAARASVRVAQPFSGPDKPFLSKGQELAAPEGNRARSVAQREGWGMAQATR